jgi:hypothetical protein
VVLSYIPGYGLTPWGWLPSGSAIGLTLLEPYQTREENMKKRLTVADVPSTPAHAAAVESVLFANLHSLVAHLAITRYDDGSARQPGTLLVRTVGASWQVTVKEPDVSGQLIFNAPTLDDALAAAALALESDQTPWQPDPWAKTQGSGRSKKKT